MNVIAEVAKYYTYELRGLYRASILTKETKNAVLSRGLGVAFFAQQLGAEFEKVDALYNNFKEEVEKYLDTVNKV